MSEFENEIFQMGVNAAAAGWRAQKAELIEALENLLKYYGEGIACDHSEGFLDDEEYEEAAKFEIQAGSLLERVRGDTNVEGA